MSENKYKSCEELSFNQYGVRIKGKFIAMKDTNVLIINVISDSSGVLVQGETTKLNKRFLVVEPINNKTTNEHGTGK